jgi:hypothetical protein
MSQVYCIRTRRKGKHLTFDEREELEAIVNKNNALPKGKRLSQKTNDFIRLISAGLPRPINHPLVIWQKMFNFYFKLLEKTR